MKLMKHRWFVNFLSERSLIKCTETNATYFVIGPLCSTVVAVVKAAGTSDGRFWSPRTGDDNVIQYVPLLSHGKWTAARYEPVSPIRIALEHGIEVAADDAPLGTTPPVTARLKDSAAYPSTKVVAKKLDLVCGL